MWLLVLAASAGVLLTALIGGSLYLVAQVPPRRAEPAAERPDTPSAPSAREAKTADVRPLDTKPAPPKGEAKPVGDPPPDQRLTQALGALTAAQVYQTYLNVGLLADAWEKDLYPEDDLRKMLDSVARLIDTVDKSLADLAGADFNDDDRKALKQSRELVTLLKTQAKELAAYWKSGDKDDAEKFQKTRRTAWAGIRELLKIDETKE
jgi:hypothetical protein